MKSGRIELTAAILAWAGCIAMLGMSLAANGQTMAPQQQGQQGQVFDIPAQPLQTALERFMTVTAYSGIYDSAITAGLQSTEVKGLMTPEDALRQLITATGLSVRYAAENTFSIIRPASVAADPSPPQAVPETGRRERAKAAYYGLLQAHINGVLCRHPSTVPGTYRLALSLWIAADGAVEKVRLLAGSGSPQRDARINAGLKQLQLPPPQAGMQQPVTLVFLPKPEGAANDCAAVQSTVQAGGEG